MELTIPLSQILLRLGVALVVGGILGWEREAKQKPAGLRTMMMVALGSASFTLIILEMFHSIGGNEAASDPTRVVEGIIGGIGFLGAGSIIQSRQSVEGITTAATIWVVGAIGVGCGAGSFAIVVLTAIFAFAILTILPLFARQIKPTQES